MSETESDDRLVTTRAAELKRRHNLRDEVAQTAAWCELGYSASGAADKINVTEATVSSRIEQLEERFGYGCCMTKADRTGPLEGRADLRRCPTTGCGARSVVSLNEATETFPTKSDEFERAIRKAVGKGETHLCTACYGTFQLKTGSDAEDSPESAPGVAEALQTDARWVAHRSSDKRPCAPWQTGDTDPADAQNFYNQTHFAEAWEWSQMLPIGLGVVLTESDPFVAIDLDSCRDPATGDVDEEAQATVDRLDSYTEVSMSGTGLHVWVLGDPPDSVTSKADGFEMYAQGQYVSVTFDHLAGTPTSIEERGDVVSELFEEYGGSFPTVTDARSYDGDPPESPLYQADITELYPGTKRGGNTPHPVHTSDTGANFKVDAERPWVWRCWRCEVTGNVSQLLAMAYLVAEEEETPSTVDCERIAEQFKRDDALVTKTWAWAVAEELIPPTDIPNRVNPGELADGD